MPLNPAIIMGYQQPQIDTPIDSMGKLMKFREAASQEALRSAQVQHMQSLERQQQIKEEADRREQADEAALQQIQGDPESYSKIMGGDFSVLAGKVSPERLANVQKTVSDFHHQQSLRAEDDLKAHNAGLGELVNAAEGLKELGDIEEINAQLPNVIDNLSRAGAFKAAQVDPTKVPQHITDVKELDTWLASVGGLMAANDAGLKRKAAKLGTELTEAQIAANKALATQREAPKAITKETLAVEAAGGDQKAAAALKLLSPEKSAGERNPTEASLALLAAQGDKSAEAALKRLDQSKRESRPDKASGNLRPVTSGDAGRIAGYDTSLDELRAVDTALSETKGATGTKAALGAWVWPAITDATGFGVEAKQRQATIDRVKQIIGKALEGGVLRKEDEVKYTKILPTISDTPEVASSKIRGLDEAIRDKRRTHLDALEDAGYDVSKFAKRPAHGDTSVGGGIPTPKTQAEYDGLAKGAKFHKPSDPKVYTKQ